MARHAQPSNQLMRRALQGALFIALAVGGAPLALAQEPPAPRVEITPAKLEQDQVSRAVQADYTLFNHDVTPQTLVLTVTGLSHDLEGGPAFEGAPPPEARMRLSHARITLPAGGRQTIRMSARIPDGVGGLYAGVVATLETPPGSGEVVVRRRVAGSVLVRGPRPWNESCVVESINLEGPASAPRLVAAVRNTGDVHQRPSADVRVFRNNKQIASEKLTAEVVLPGSARNLRARWDPPAGPLAGLSYESDLCGATKRFSPPTPVIPGRSDQVDGGLDNGVVFAVGLLLLLVVLFLLFLAWRRRKRKDDEEPASTLDV